MVVYLQETFQFSEFDDVFSGYNSSEHGPEDDGSEFTCDGGAGPGRGPQQLFRSVFQPLVYGLVLLLGAAGNGLLLAVLLKRRRGQRLRVTEIYLLHLAVADLLLLLTFPFALAQALRGGWPLGDVLCKAVGLLTQLNLLCGSLLLACIGFDRYLAVVHAVPGLRGRRRPRAVHLTCLALWLVCLALSVPNAAFLSVEEGPEGQVCNYHSHGVHAKNWGLARRLVTHLLCFLLPLGVMGYCYAAVVVTLRHSHRSLEKQGAIRLALLLTAVFCLCWLPYNVTLLVDTLVELEVLSGGSCESRGRLQLAVTVTESLGFAHCCLNPVLYAFVGVRFRDDLRGLLARWGCCARLPFLRAEGPARSSTSEGTTAVAVM